MTRVYLDIEVYKNYFLALFMNEQGGAKRFEMFNGDCSEFHADEIAKLIENPDIEFVTFNGISYDIPLLTMAIVYQDTELLKGASDKIIQDNVKPWAFYRNEGLREPDINHVDLKEVAPGMVGLKLYGGRMGTKWLQELPIPHDAEITEDMLPLMRKYCKNDTILTQELYRKLASQIELRRAMSAEYGMDLRSKSDAQIAEAVLKSEFSRITGEPPAKAVAQRNKFFYDPPAYIKFLTPDLQEAFKTICGAEMVLKSTGHVQMPKEINTLKIDIGNTRYKIGIGGLHSQESEIAHKADENTLLLDRDVASYYPTLMLNMQMEPGGFGKYFNPVYKRILDERLVAKRKMGELERRLDILAKELASMEKVS